MGSSGGNTLIDILKGNNYKLPADTFSETDPIKFIDHLNRSFDNYIDDLRTHSKSLFEFIPKFDASQPKLLSIRPEIFIKEVEEIINNIKLVYKYFLKGDIKSAQEYFDTLNFEDYFIDPIGDEIITINHGNSFYRVRKSDDIIKPKEWEKMFHLPFNLRHIISTQRYSVQGLPCLYMGKTVDVCLKELKLSSLENIKILKLENTINLKFINLKPLDFSQFNFSEIEEANNNPASIKKNAARILKYAKYYPIFYCLYQKINYQTENTTFKIDYILTQMVLFWLMNLRNTGNTDLSDTSGIMYLSMFCKNNHYVNQNVSDNLNFAIPVYSTSTNDGHCSTLNGWFKKSQVYDHNIMANNISKSNLDYIEDLLDV